MKFLLFFFSKICAYAHIYVFTYKIYIFSEYNCLGRLPEFVSAIWQLLTSTGLELKYDLLVSTALGFLGSVAEQTGNNKLFSEGEALKTICEQVWAHRKTISKKQFGQKIFGSKAF